MEELAGRRVERVRDVRDRGGGPGRGERDVERGRRVRLERLALLARVVARELVAPFAGADELIARRRAEADEFFDAITPAAVDDDAKAVMRQALAGMLWSKQSYYFDVDRWLRERHAHPLRAPARRGSRNDTWFHMVNHDVVSMPDKWEYPWYAAWDLAFTAFLWPWSIQTSRNARSL